MARSDPMSTAWKACRRAAAGVAGFALLACAPGARAEDGAAAGKALFARCTMCHSAEAGVNKLGPSLRGVVGRPSASVAGFRYSPAMSAYRKTWDAATLDAFLKDPRAQVPGTYMAFGGLPQDKDRQAIVAYLATLM